MTYSIPRIAAIGYTEMPTVRNTVPITVDEVQPFHLTIMNGRVEYTSEPVALF